jgi:hypothetical protein
VRSINNLLDSCLLGTIYQHFRVVGDSIPRVPESVVEPYPVGLHHRLASLQTASEVLGIEGEWEIGDARGVQFPGTLGVVSEVDDGVTLLKQDFCDVSAGEGVGSSDGNLHN